MPKQSKTPVSALRTNWLHILLSLSGEEQHGYGIMQEVLERTNGQVKLWPASLYGSLKQMIEVGLIEESKNRPAPEEDDSRRRYYKLTRSGRRALEQEIARLEDLVRAIHHKRQQEV